MRRALECRLPWPPDAVFHGDCGRGAGVASPRPILKKRRRSSVATRLAQDVHGPMRVLRCTTVSRDALVVACRAALADRRRTSTGMPFRTCRPWSLSTTSLASWLLRSAVVQTSPERAYPATREAMGTVMSPTNLQTKVLTTTSTSTRAARMAEAESSNTARQPSPVDFTTRPERFGEGRRRMKVVADAFGERPVLKLVYAALIQATGVARHQGHGVRAQAGRGHPRGTRRGARPASCATCHAPARRQGPGAGRLPAPSHAFAASKPIKAPDARVALTYRQPDQ